MRAVIVSVNYGDLLQITLPQNMHHFTNVTVVTTASDAMTCEVATALQCQVIQTELFYADGAWFNKFKALEYALDSVGRRGWLCLLDADIILPPSLGKFHPEIGKLYSPLRKWWPDITRPAPPAERWSTLPYIEDRKSNCFAGYTQIFHADDPVLVQSPWHRVDYDNASDGDTDFSRKWAKCNRVRPQFDVLHLGDIATNWCGRAAAYTDGTVPPDAASKMCAVDAFLQSRKKRKTK